jgi:hypothetical protein
MSLGLLCNSNSVVSLHAVRDGTNTETMPGPAAAMTRASRFQFPNGPTRK